MICSQEDKPGTHKSPREISHETGISRRSVQRIAKLDLHLKTFRRREVQLLSMFHFSAPPCIFISGHVKHHKAFLPARRYASAGLCDSDVSVRLSVRHTPVLCLAEQSRIVQCIPSDSPITLVSG